MSSPIIIVLGSPNDPEGRLTSLARERCRLATRLASDNPSARLLPTGGFGALFNTTDTPHATYLRKHLEELGVEPTRILPAALSRNTIEDASLSKPIVSSHGASMLLIVTSDYHVPRARFLFQREFADTGLPLAFMSSVTDEAACELDLVALKQHEGRALAKFLEDSAEGDRHADGRAAQRRRRR